MEWLDFINQRIGEKNEVKAYISNYDKANKT